MNNTAGKAAKTWTVTFGDIARVYYTDYHAEQFMRALRLNGTPFTLKVSFWSPSTLQSTAL